MIRDAIRISQINLTEQQMRAMFPKKLKHRLFPSVQPAFKNRLDEFRKASDPGDLLYNSAASDNRTDPLSHRRTEMAQLRLRNSKSPLMHREVTVLRAITEELMHPPNLSRFNADTAKADALPHCC